MLDLYVIVDTAAALYDGGWRAGDREELMYEYDLTSEEAIALCTLLEAIETVHT